jgi:omega-6 fatty acid desaturase (delta-12 desaturase)
MSNLNIKQLRSVVAKYTKPSTGLALTIFATDILVYITAIAGVIFLENIYARIACSLLAGLIISLLFVVAHDAAHDSFTNSRLLNRIIARICYIPFLNNYSLWLIAHNRMHHQHTNLKGENSWSPLSKQEYDALPAWRQKLERFYRSPAGICFNYMVERWWKNKFFPFKRIVGEYKAVYWMDFLFLIACLGIYLGVLVSAGNSFVHTNAVELIVLGFVVPFVYASFIVGMSVYLQHTHESIPWFETEAEMQQLGKTEETTMHVRFPQWYNLISHNVMEHTAHHVDPRIPLYRLAEAQKTLISVLGIEMSAITFTVSGFLKTMSICKLYDYKNHCWLDFSGHPSSRSLLDSEDEKIKYQHAA